MKTILAFLQKVPLQARLLAGGAFAVLVLGIVSVRDCSVAHAAASQLQDARHAVTAALDSAARASAAARAERTRGDSARAASASEGARADSAEGVADSLAATYHATAAVSPAQCSTVVRTANAALAAANISHLDLELTVHSALTADSLHVRALDTTALALDRLRVSSAALVTASRPSLLAALVPRPGFGAALGYDPIRKQPAVIVGVTLGWRF